MEEIKISDVKINKRIREDIGNIEILCASISEVGLLQLPVVNENNELVLGQRRFEALKRLGRKHIPVDRLDVKDPFLAEIHENTMRKDFTISEVAKIKREIEERLVRGRPPKGGKLPPFQGKSRDIVSKITGVSPRTIDKMEAIVNHGDKKIIEKVDDKKASIDYAYLQIKRERARTQPIPFPQGQFNVIYADPPWEYDNKPRGAPDDHYPTMELEKICSMQIPSDDNAMLYLWTTITKYYDSLQVFKAWGFEYLSQMVWVKAQDGKIQQECIQIGTGYYVRGSHEILLICRKGNMPPPAEHYRHSSVLVAERTRHSQKPSQVYEIIEQMYPGCKYLELFARNKREGWTSWGNEIDL